MKKLFTSLLLLIVLLCSGSIKAQETTVYSNSGDNYQIVKVSDTEYRVEPINTGSPANFQNLNDNTFDGQSAFMSCTGKITLKGKFSNIDGLKKNLCFTNVVLSDFIKWNRQVNVISYWPYEEEVLKDEAELFTTNYKLKDFFPQATKVSLPNYEEEAWVDFFLSVNTIEEITFGTATKRILCAETGTTSSTNGVWPAWEADQNNPTGPVRGACALKTLNFNEGLEEIGVNTFLNCANITSLTFPESLKVIGINAFKHTRELTSLDFTNNTNLTTIDASAFAGKHNNAGERSKLSSVTLPSGDTFTGFGNYVFSSTSIKELDFRNCTGITRFLHDGGSTEPQYTGGFRTFYFYSSLKRIWFPPNLTYVMPDIFGGKSSAESGDDLTNPDNISTILEEAYFTGHITKDDYDLSKCENARAKDVIDESKKLKLDDYAFCQIPTLKTVVLSNNVWYIGQEAFKQCHLTEISIPASVETIGAKAFEQNDYMTKVTFEEITADCKPCKGRETSIPGGDGTGGQGHGAFNNCKAITDVYINTTSNLKCQNNAFDQHITWGAGDAEKPFATLHFPKENINNYVNTSHYLTDAIVANKGLFHDWLMTHYDLAGVPNMNGWYEFINSGPSSSELSSPGQEIILRTFSDYELSYLVPSGLRAYIVNKVEKDGDTYVATLKRVEVIPAKTGVILYGHPNGWDAAGNPTLSLTPVYYAPSGERVQVDVDTWVTAGENEGLPLCRANWIENGGTQGADMKNYLEPSSTDPNYTGTDHPEWQNGGIFLKPYENIAEIENPLKMNPAGKVAYRNFGLGRYNSIVNVENKQALEGDETNYAAFFRLQMGVLGSGKAYLHMDASEYPVEQGAEILVNKDEKEGDFSYYYEYGASDGIPYDFRDPQNNDKNKKGWWIYNHGFDWEIVDDHYAIEDSEGNKEYKSRMNWGVCPDRLKTISMAPRFLGELEDTDDIVKMVIPANPNANTEYYTLQGVKVSDPSKGVYIRNGKKVIIK